MSYEGYTIFLCVNGHDNRYDAYDDTPTSCDDCGKPMAWRYGVDCTNDSGVHPVLKVHKEAEVDVCCKCGHHRTVAEKQCKIPENAGRLLVEPEMLNVPISTVKFLDVDSGEEFDTKEAAWENKSKEWS